MGPAPPALIWLKTTEMTPPVTPTLPNGSSSLGNHSSEGCIGIDGAALNTLSVSDDEQVCNRTRGPYTLGRSENSRLEDSDI